MSEAAAEAAMLAEALSQMSHDAADTINRRALSKGMDCPEGEDTAHGESSSPPLDEYASSDAPDAEHNDEEGVSQLNFRELMNPEPFELSHYDVEEFCADHLDDFFEYCNTEYLPKTCEEDLKVEFEIDRSDQPEIDLISAFTKVFHWVRKEGIDLYQAGEDDAACVVESYGQHLLELVDNYVVDSNRRYLIPPSLVGKMYEEVGRASAVLDHLGKARYRFDKAIQMYDAVLKDVEKTGPDAKKSNGASRSQQSTHTAEFARFRKTICALSYARVLRRLEQDVKATDQYLVALKGSAAIALGEMEIPEEVGNETQEDVNDIAEEYIRAVGEIKRAAAVPVIEVVSALFDVLRHVHGQVSIRICRRAADAYVRQGEVQAAHDLLDETRIRIEFGLGVKRDDEQEISVDVASSELSCSDLSSRSSRYASTGYHRSDLVKVEQCMTQCCIALRDGPGAVSHWRRVCELYLNIQGHESDVVKQCHDTLKVLQANAASISKPKQRSSPGVDTINENVNENETENEDGWDA